MFEEEKFKLPEEELERKMYSLAIEFLKEKGYDQYEISIFQKRIKNVSII